MERLQINRPEQRRIKDVKRLHRKYRELISEARRVYGLVGRTNYGPLLLAIANWEGERLTYPDGADKEDARLSDVGDWRSTPGNAEAAAAAAMVMQARKALSSVPQSAPATGDAAFWIWDTVLSDTLMRKRSVQSALLYNSVRADKLLRWIVEGMGKRRWAEFMTTVVLPRQMGVNIIDDEEDV